MDGDLLREVRDEAYHLRVITRQLRNQTKTLAAAYFDSEQRLERLIDQIENDDMESPRQEAQGNGSSRQADRQLR